MESTWSTLILPLSEGAFARKPLVHIIEEDYSYFDARYGFTETTTAPEMLRHSRWLASAYGTPPKSKDWTGIDAKRLLTEQLTFQDSCVSLGLQLCDMLASILRRALNDRLQFPGWKDFGRLLVQHLKPGTGFILLGAGAPVPMLGHAEKVCQALHAKAKDMFCERIRNAGDPQTPS
jgi:hypothetical protein